MTNQFDFKGLFDSVPEQQPAGSEPVEVERARRTDPPTSHEAAAVVQDTATTRGFILYILKQFGPRTDEVLITSMRRLGRKESDSGIRSRRAELVRRGLVVKNGTSRTESGRKSIVWKVAE